MFRRIWQTFLARNKEFYRDRAALGWSILFPILLIFGMAFAFKGGDNTVFKVGILGSKANSNVAFFNTKHLEFIEFNDSNHAKEKLTRHKIDFLIEPESRQYWLNVKSPKSYLVEKVLLGTQLNTSTFEWKKQEVAMPETTYVDWVLPGVLAMSMMFGALWGIGYVLVNYRKNGTLRRFKATPITVFEFLMAQILSRYMVVLITTAIVFAGCYFTIGYKMIGSYLDLFVIFSLGSLSMICCGLIVAARTSSKELADGLLNLISWPMIMFSGVWFSLEGTNPALQKLAQFFPLTHIVDGMRAIMIEGATLWSVSTNAFVLLGTSVIFLAIGILIFRWE